MKASATEDFIVGSQLHVPDGSVWVFTKAVEALEPGTYIDFNVNGNATKFKGGFRMPPGICSNTVPNNWYFWGCVRTPQVAKGPTAPGILVPSTKKAEIG